MLKRPYTLSCHCGAVVLEVDAELKDVGECNCSMCGRSGYLSWYVPQESVKLVSQKQQLSSYFWRFASEGFHFCSTCGIAVFRSWRDDLSVNARCIRGLDVFTLELRRGNGRDEMPPGPYD